MRKLIQMLCIAAVACALTAVVGCSKKEEGPMEKMGKSLDKATDDASKTMKEGAAKADEAAKDAAEKAEEATK